VKRLSRLSWIIVFLGSPWNAAADSCVDSKVAARMSLISGNYAEFEIRNESTSPLLLHGKGVPWITRDSISMLAVDAKSKDPFDGVPPPEDDFALRDPIQLGVGQRISGKIDLAKHVLRLADLTANGDTILYWFYEPKDSSGLRIGRCGGWLFLPRADSRR
jgi:hypothetical protein